MTPTVSTVPWWYVAALAGVFTLIGASLGFLGTWLTARQKNKLDDHRRFDADVIAAYIRLDAVADVLHENAGGDLAEEKKVFWELYPEVVSLVTRLELITSPEIYGLAEDFSHIMFQMAPGSLESLEPSAPSMPEIQQVLTDLRLAIRHEIRVGIPKGEYSSEHYDRLADRDARREARRAKFGWLLRSPTHLKSNEVSDPWSR